MKRAVKGGVPLQLQIHTQKLHTGCFKLPLSSIEFGIIIHGTLVLFFFVVTQPPHNTLPQYW